MYILATFIQVIIKYKKKYINLTCMQQIYTYLLTA